MSKSMRCFRQPVRFCVTGVRSATGKFFLREEKYKQALDKPHENGVLNLLHEGFEMIFGFSHRWKGAAPWVTRNRIKRSSAQVVPPVDRSYKNIIGTRIFYEEHLVFVSCMWIWCLSDANSSKFGDRRWWNFAMSSYEVNSEVVGD